jgi:hypothetical protein
VNIAEVNKDIKVITLREIGTKLKINTIIEKNIIATSKISWK